MTITEEAEQAMTGETLDFKDYSSAVGSVIENNTLGTNGVQVEEFASFAGVKGVELLKAGRWPAKSGPVTITLAHLRSIVEAAQDPTLREGVLKLGHASPLNEGRPAFGWVRNLRLDGDKLRGDYASMPLRLARLVVGKPGEPAPFRSRSVELKRDVKAPSGRTYPLVLSAVALLGETLPAIQSLEDIYDMYEEETDIAASADEEIETLVLGGGELETGFGDEIQQMATGLGTIEPTPPNTEDAMPESDTVEKERETETEKTTEKVTEPAPKEEETVEERDNEVNPGPSHPPEGVIEMSQGAYDALVADAAAGRAAREQQLEEHRQKVLDDAIKAGKITAPEREHFATLLSAAPEETEVLLSHLAPRLHMVELGHSQDNETRKSDTLEALFGPEKEASIG